ncbi:MAG: ABC transporter permease [Deltaproteobacteria bacterium]
MLIQDARYGLRMLGKNPGFTAVAVLTLALGIGATTAIFSVAYGVLLRPLPYPQPDRIVELHEVNLKGGEMNFADPNFADVHKESHSLDGAAQYSAWTQVVTGGSEPTRTMTAAVSADFFRIMGVAPIRGRGFGPDEQKFGAAPSALVGYDYWQQNLGGVQDLSSIKLRLSNQAASVVGVLPPGFHFPFGSEVWVPRELYETLPSRTAHNWHVIGRLRPGVTIVQAHAELSGIARRLKQQFGQDTMMEEVSVASLADAMTAPVRPALIMLLGAVGFLLLVACANVANLMLARAAARERELAVRAALGAGRGRLVRQFLTESLMVSGAGGALGVLAASWGVAALIALAPGYIPRLEEVSVNLPVLIFALILSLFVAVLLGSFTAIRATSRNLQATLSEGGYSRAGSLRLQRLGRSIVGAQLAVTLVLLVGAGLLGRSLMKLLSIDPGFQTGHIVTMDVVLPGDEGNAFTGKDSEQLRRVRFIHDVLTGVDHLPKVRAAGGTNGLPLTSGLADGIYVTMSPGEKVPGMKELEQLFHNKERTGDANYCVVTPGYFSTLGIRLLRGRLFDDRDNRDSPHVALISESLAREKWPNEDPLGHQIEFGNMDGDLRPLTIVGVVGDIREDSLESKPFPTIYVNCLQRPQSTDHFTFVMQTDGDLGALISQVRQIVRELAPDIPPRFSTFDQVLSSSLQSRRFNLILVGVFAAAALILAAAGVFGVMAYSVERRTREIGVRVALGATRRQVLSLVLGQALLTAAVGVAAGVLGSLALTRLVRSLLFGVGATDPMTFSAVALLLTGVALAASFIPARRAAKVDPTVALRHE